MNPMLKRCIEAVRNSANDAEGEAGDVYAQIARAVIKELRYLKESPDVLEAGCSAHPPGDYHSGTSLGAIVACEWDAMLAKVLE